MKKLTLIFIALIFALIAVGQPATLIEYPYLVKHMSDKDQIFTATVGKYFVGYSTISQGDSVLYYSSSGTQSGSGTYGSPLPIDSINTLKSNGKRVLARIKRGDVYSGTITIADSNIVVCSYSTVNTTAKPIVNYIDYYGKTNIYINNIEQTYNGYYFVSNSGNDEYSGTEPDSAWATIANINSSDFEPGDNILFKAGDMWRGETLTINWSGEASNPIVFGAYGAGDKPVFNGAEVISNWTLSGTPNVWRTPAPIKAADPHSYRTVVVIDGVRFMPVDLLADLDADLEYYAENPTGTVDDYIYVYSLTNPSTRTAELSTKMYGILDGLGTPLDSNIVIKDLEFRYYGYAGISLRGVQNGTLGTYHKGNYLTDNCTFYHNREFAVQMRDGFSNNIIQNNTVSYCGNGLYTSRGSNNNSFINNHITHTFAYTNTDGHAIGIYSSRGALVENNYIAYGNAALIGLDEADAIIRYNEVHANGTAVDVCVAIASNVINAGDTVDIYYNILFGEKPKGVCLTTGTTNGKVNVFNNTIVTDAHTSGIDISYGINITLKNNIFYNSGSTQRIVRYVYDHAGVVSDYNSWYNKLPAPYYVYSYTTLAAWKTAEQKDLNSISGDPMVISAPTDLRLQTGSPAINAGVNVGLTRDFAGNPIIGNPDIGAYEFVDNGDVTAPVVTFVIPSTAYLTVNFTTFTATDNVAVTGYLISESSTIPLANNAGWTTTAPTSYTFSTPGEKTLYAWARDANGNISNTASDNVTASYDFSTLDNGLIAWYDFDETSGLLQDLSGNGLHASSHGSNITINQPGLPTKSYLFNTAWTSKVAINDNNLLTPTDSFTIVMWLNLNTINTHQTLIAKLEGSNLEWLVFLNNFNKLTFRFYQNGTTAHTARVTTNALDNNTDYCIILETSNILTYNAAKIFINNSQWSSAGSGLVTITNVLNGTSGVSIGSEAAVNYTGLSANISQTIMYDRILTASEKAALYNDGNGISYGNTQ